MRKQIFTGLLVCALVGLDVRAQEETNSFRAGPHMAVQEASLQNGIRLTEKAQNVIGVKTKPLGSRPFSVPAGALVYYGDKIGVYRLRNGWFKLIEIQKLGKKGEAVSVSSSDLREDDLIAVEGVALLRVSEMDAFGGEE